MIDNDITQIRKTDKHFWIPTISFPSLTEEMLETESMLREEFEKTGTLNNLSLDEL